MKFCRVDATIVALFSALCIVYLASVFAIHANPADASEQRLLLAHQGLNVATLAGLLTVMQWASRRCESAKTMSFAWGTTAALALSLITRLALGLAMPARRSAFTPWDTAVTFASTLVVLSELFFVFVRGTPLNVVIFALALLFAMPALTSLPRMLSADARPDQSLLTTSLDVSWRAYFNASVQNVPTSTQALLEVKDNVLYVAFRGTQDKTDAKTDAAFAATRVTWLKTKAKAHSGFLRAYDSIRDEVGRAIKDTLYKQDPVTAIVFTGHSLGGALAVLAAQDYAENARVPNLDLKVCTFGAPQVGDQAFVTLFDQRVPTAVRVVNPHDKVPASLTAAYVHVKGYYPVTTLTKDIFPTSHKLSSYKIGIARGRTATAFGIIAPGMYLAAGAGALYALRRFV